MRDMPRQIQVRVPATTANLGSGFDILGLALQLYNVFTLTLTSESGWHVHLPPGINLPPDDSNLVLRASMGYCTPHSVCTIRRLLIPQFRQWMSVGHTVVGSCSQA